MIERIVLSMNITYNITQNFSKLMGVSRFIQTDHLYVFVGEPGGRISLWLRSHSTGICMKSCPRGAAPRVWQTDALPVEPGPQMRTDKARSGSSSLSHGPAKHGSEMR